MVEDTNITAKPKGGWSPEGRAKANENLKPAKPWPKGVSGNPAGQGGRPKKEHSITSRLKAEGKKRKTYTIGGVKYRGTQEEILAKRMYDQAIRRVNPKLVQEIFDRQDGRPVSALELLTKDGKPIRLIVEYDGNKRA